MDGYTKIDTDETKKQEAEMFEVQEIKINQLNSEGLEVKENMEEKLRTEERGAGEASVERGNAREQQAYQNSYSYSNPEGSSHNSLNPYGHPISYGNQNQAASINPDGNQNQAVNQNPYGNQNQIVNQNPYGNQNQAVNQNPYGNQNQVANQNPYANPVMYVNQTPYGNRSSYDSQNPYYGGELQTGGLQNHENPHRRRGNGFRKVLAVAGLALLFGVLAGGSFLGVNYIYDTVMEQDDGLTSSNGQGLGDTGTTTQKPNLIQNSTVVNSSYIEGTSVSDIAEAAMPSTVAINSTFTTASWFGQYESSGSGSGIIIGRNETELLIVTNNHVINRANTITAVLIDGTEVAATVKGTAASTDLAVIALPLDELSEETRNSIKIATLGSSDEIKVGEMVVAIGNALGYGQSVTVGYISAKDREVSIDNTKMTLLQTDAAINPGNSGGALLNLKGEVIGINSVKYADENVEGMCFAIPVSRVTDIIENLMNSLSAEEKGYLGVMVQDIQEAEAEYFGWPIGIRVQGFSEESAAEEAGIQIGDYITSVDGVTVETANELVERVTSRPYGTKVTLTVQRTVDGKLTEFDVTVVLRQNTETTEIK